MESDTFDQLPLFFFHSLRFDGTLVVLLSVADEPAYEVTFHSVRAFRCFNESDAWEYLKSYSGRTLVVSEDAGCGIFLSETAPYLLDYRKQLLDAVMAEQTASCLIATPDECVEVICCGSPTWRRL